MDPNRATPPPVRGTGVVRFGKVSMELMVVNIQCEFGWYKRELLCVWLQEKPDLRDFDDLCPAPIPPDCPACPPRNDTSWCRSGGFELLDMVGWEILPLGNLSQPDPNNRTQGLRPKESPLEVSYCQDYHSVLLCSLQVASSRLLENLYSTVTLSRLRLVRG